MKITTDQASSFKPITVHITLESLNELNRLKAHVTSMFNDYLGNHLCVNITEVSKICTTFINLQPFLKETKDPWNPTKEEIDGYQAT